MLLGIAAVLLTASVAVAATARTQPASTPGNTAVSAACLGWCGWCDILENKYEVIPVENFPNDSESTSLCGHHVPCMWECQESRSTHDINSLTRAVAEADVNELRSLLRDVEGLELNLERHAIQLAGCTEGDVVLHIPLSERQVAVLGSRAERAVLK